MPDNDKRIRELRDALLARSPALVPPELAPVRAAVALILRVRPDDLDVLLIERPKNDTDPWSGHIALPGGRRAEGEQDLQTAIRETAEEVGVDLHATGSLLGRLNDVQPSRGGPQIAVATFAFAVADGTLLRPDPREVARTVWAPLSHLRNPESSGEHVHLLPDGRDVRFPGIQFGDHTIWGLTYRILTQFFSVIGPAILPDKRS